MFQDSSNTMLAKNSRNIFQIVLVAAFLLFICFPCSIFSAAQNQCIASSKDSFIWEYIDDIELSEVGTVKQYRLKEKFVHKPEFECLVQMGLEIFPALEPTPSFFQEKVFKDPPIKYALNFFGFTFTIKENSEIEMTIPTVQTLKNQWQAYYQSELNLWTANGIASDHDFIKSFYNYDFLLSTDAEYVHDMTFHILPALYNDFYLAVYKQKNFRNKLKKLKKFVKSLDQEIEEGEHSEKIKDQLRLRLAVIIDSLSSTLKTSWTVKKLKTYLNRPIFASQKIHWQIHIDNSPSGFDQQEEKHLMQIFNHLIERIDCKPPAASFANSM